MAIDITASAVTCSRCGKEYGSARTNFYTSYATSYKGIRRLTICKHCVDSLFDTYYNQCGNYKDAMRQMCRKLDLYWNETQFNVAESRSTPRTLFNTYMSCINTPSLAGRCYDDTLVEEGKLWGFVGQEPEPTEDEVVEEQIPEEVQVFWGSGLSAKKYKLLEERMAYILKKLKLNRDDIDVGTELILKQACGLELDIADARVEGKPVDKLVNSLNTLLGSANLKPAQQKQETNDGDYINTPLGVWIDRYEHQKPLPDTYEDSPLLRYVFTWMGHVLKMLGKKNAYSQFYEDEIAHLRVERPEYDGDDEELLSDYMLSGDDDEVE